MVSGPYSLPTHPPIYCPVPRAVKPDACPTFISHSLFPQHSAGSVAKHSMEISRRCAREEVSDDLPMSIEEVESAPGLYPNQMVDAQKRRDRLKNKTKDKIRELHSRLMERAYSHQMVDAPKRRERLKSKTKDNIRELKSRLMERVRNAVTLARSTSILCPLFTRSMWMASRISLARGLTSEPSLHRYNSQMRSISSFRKASRYTACSPRTVMTGSPLALENVRSSANNDGNATRLVRMETAIVPRGKP